LRLDVGDSIYVPFPEQTGRIAIEFDAWIDSFWSKFLIAPTENFNFEDPLIRGTAYYIHAGPYVRWMDAGYPQYYDELWRWHDVPNCPREGWVRVKMVLDVPRLRFDLFCGDMETPLYGGWFRHATTQEISGLIIRKEADTVGAQSLWIDNLAVRAIAEAPTAPDSLTITVDNDAPGASYDGNWNPSDSGDAFEGDDYLVHAATVGQATFDWMTPIEWPAAYNVFARCPQVPGLSPEAIYTVYHDGGETRLVADQNSADGEWIFLGLYDFLQSDGQVSLSAGPEGIVAADAVRFELNHVGPPAHSNWNQIFEDEFDGTSLDWSVWSSQAGPSAGRNESRWPENNEVRDGVLHQVFKFDPSRYPGKDWTSAHIWTQQQFKYGYYECTMRYAAAPSLNNAFWLYRPYGFYPQLEVDINEGHYPNEIAMNTHYLTASDEHYTKGQSIQIPGLFLSDEFHVYGCEYTENEIIYYFDGRIVRRQPHAYRPGIELSQDIRFSTAVFDTPALSMAADGASMDMEYVRAWTAESPRPTARPLVGQVDPRGKRTIVLSEDFESVPLRENPQGWDPFYGTPGVRTNPSGPGKAVMVGVPLPLVLDGLYVPVPDVQGRAEIEFDLYTDSAWCRFKMMPTGDFDRDDISAYYDAIAVDSGPHLQWRDAGYVNYFHDDRYFDGPATIAEEWTRVKILMDIPAGIFDFFIEDMEHPASTGFFRNAIGEVSGIILLKESGPHDPTAVYLDNLEVRSLEYETGDVTIQTNPSGAGWVVTDILGGSHPGQGAKTLTHIPAGLVEITWLPVAGYDLPSTNPMTLFLPSDGNITFFGNYTAQPPTQDSFDSADLIDGTTGNVQSDNSNATREPNEPDHGDASIWWNWTAPNADRFCLWVAADFPTAIHAYTGDQIDLLTPVFRQDDPVGNPNLQVVFDARAGETYHIAVTSLTSDTGALVLGWQPIGKPELWLADFGTSPAFANLRQNPRYLADMNGDGRDDLVGFSENGVEVAVSSGDRFVYAGIWNDNFNFAHGWRADLHIRTVVDANGDGLADIVGIGDKAVIIALNEGGILGEPYAALSGFSARDGGWDVENHPRIIRDVDGDGAADIVGFGERKIVVALANGFGGFHEPTSWSNDFTSAEGWDTTLHSRTLADLNGDGWLDILGYRDETAWVARAVDLDAGGTPDAFSMTTAWLSGLDLDPDRSLTADANGDGLADALLFNNEGLYLGLSTGVGFLPQGLQTPDFGTSQGWTLNGNPRLTADLNGDGLADLTGFGNRYAHVALATPAGLRKQGVWMEGMAGEDWDPERHPRLIGDINGDGFDDLVGVNEQGAWVLLSPWRTVPPPSTGVSVWQQFR
ncbi:VCBS repeat-containing protein, partial [bacterium]|nr:VCBS repeat-containing protein [bacterium]